MGALPTLLPHGCRHALRSCPSEGASLLGCVALEAASMIPSDVQALLGNRGLALSCREHRELLPEERDGS